jgi:hypothetical protein
MNPQSTSLMRAITAPIILLTVGVLFLFGRFTGFRFGETWPVLLIVVGLLRLLGGGRRRRDAYYPPAAPPPPPPYTGPGDRP